MSEEELKEVNEIFLEFFGETYTDMENRKKEKPKEMFCYICGKNLSDDGVVLVNGNGKHACTDHFKIDRRNIIRLKGDKKAELSKER